MAQTPFKPNWYKARKLYLNIKNNTIIPMSHAVAAVLLDFFLGSNRQLSTKINSNEK